MTIDRIYQIRRNKKFKQSKLAMEITEKNGKQGTTQKHLQNNFQVVTSNTFGKLCPPDLPVTLQQ